MRRWWVAWSLCLVAGCASMPDAAGPVVRTESGEAAEVRTLMVDGRLRTYRLHLPPSEIRRTPAPLVIVFHGHGSTARRVMRRSGMNAASDQEGFIVAYPEGTSWLGIPWRSWNAGNCCGYAMRRRIDDVAFIRAMIDTLQRTHAIDPRRVYAAGVSNGGMMAYRLGCELSDRLAAIGVVAGAFGFEPCRPSQPMPAVIVHGTDDQYVPYEGGRSAKSGYRRVDRSVAETVAFWVRHNGCGASSSVERHGTVVLESYGGGMNDAEVVLYTIDGGSHAWPAGDANVRFVATTRLWKFFSHHAKRN